MLGQNTLKQRNKLKITYFLKMNQVLESKFL